MSEKRKPNWSVCVKLPTDKWHTIGGAWDGPKGISVRLDQGETATGSFMLFPYKERSWGGREQGSYPKGHPGDIRAGESMEQYFARRRSESNSWPSVEEYLASKGQAPVHTPKPASDLQDYMDRKRAERAAGAPPASDAYGGTDNAADRHNDDDGPAWL